MNLKYVLPLMLINWANATITPIKSIREARTVFHKTDASTLVVFDLIDTLLKSHKEDYNPKLKPDINTREFENYKENGMDVTLSAVMAHSKRHLVEPELATIVEIARKNQSKVVALSHYLVGAWGMIKSIQEWRFQQLKLAGLDLSPSFGDSVVQLDALSAYRKTRPVYYRGILFTNGHSKGDTLEAFLAQVNWRPKSIIAIDDNLAYLRLIEQMAHKNKIPFQGFHYRAATL